MGYQEVRQPLWIENKDIQPCVKVVLSGPFDISQMSSYVVLETTRPVSDPYCNTPSPEVITFDLPVESLSRSTYA